MSGLKIIYNRIDEIIRMFPSEAEDIIDRTRLQVESVAKVSMGGESKHGKIYQRRGRMHQASAPGEAPAVDTGNLMTSVQSQMEGKSAAIVWVGAEYGKDLEFGTTRIGARPFLRPALEKAKRGFVEAFRRLEERFR